MAASPEDDAPTMTGTPGRRHVDLPEDDDGDDTTGALAGPPAGSQGDVEDRTVQQQVVSPPAGPRVQPVPSPPSQAQSTIPSSIPPRVAAPSAVGASMSDDHEDLELDDDDDSEDEITTTASRGSSSFAGLAIPGVVQISAVEDDELLDETEVRTLPGMLALNTPGAASTHGSPPPPRPAAGVPPPQPATEDEAEDDGVTTQAEAPQVGSVADLAASIGILPASSAPVTEPLAPITQAMNADLAVPTRPGLGAKSLADDSVDEPATRPGLGEPPTPPRKLPRLDSFANDDDDDESVTTHRAALEPYVEDSVTTQAPAVSEDLLAAAVAGPVRATGMGAASLEDGATLRVKRKAAEPSPADGEPESITTQAPGPLTNILRVIASEAGPGAVGGIADEEDLPENRTAVMANAPLKRMISALTGDPSADGSGSLPAIRPTGPPLTMPHGSSSAAPRLAPSSESGLRVARASEDRASLGALGVAEARPSGIARSASPSGPRAQRPFLATEASFVPPQPSVHDVDLGRGPRYGLLVGIVALISIVVPVVLFVVLRGRTEDVPQVPSEAASERQAYDGTPRGKLDKKAAAAAAASASAAASAAAASASASASASAHRPPPRSPLGRR